MSQYYKAIIYSGVLTAILLLCTFVLGITELNFEIHKVFGIFTFLLACLHAGLIVNKNLKLKKGK